MKIVVLMSGGIDSTVLLYQLLDERHQVTAIGFDYGQRHLKELGCAKAIAEERCVTHVTVPLPYIHGSALTDLDPSASVVVPNRNMIMLAFATAMALDSGYDAVAIATHSGDHALFPDCRPSFLDAIATAIKVATDRQVALLRPYAYMSKLDVVRLGIKLEVPFEHTWSCYMGGDDPCGECLACRERREALLLAGAPV